MTGKRTCSMTTKPRLRVVDGRLIRTPSRYIGMDISKRGAWAVTVLEKAADGKIQVINNARGQGKTYAMNTALEMMKQYNIDAVYYEAAAHMWAPPKI